MVSEKIAKKRVRNLPYLFIAGSFVTWCGRAATVHGCLRSRGQKRRYCHNAPESRWLTRGVFFRRPGAQWHAGDADGADLGEFRGYLSLRNLQVGGERPHREPQRCHVGVHDTTAHPNLRFENDGKRCLHGYRGGEVGRGRCSAGERFVCGQKHAPAAGVTCRAPRAPGRCRRRQANGRNPGPRSSPSVPSR